MTAVLKPTGVPVPDLPFQIAPPLPHIREYQDQDAEAVARMWRESAVAWPGGGPGGGEHSTVARVRQEQRDLNTLATFIAFLPDPHTGEERAVGYCSLFEYVGEASTAYVGTLSAHPGWHGRGVGRDLLRAALERTVALGYTRLDLHTWAGNLKAVPLYKKSGYFWVPETQVKMENYLPLIFRLGPAQEFFRHADWYADFKRELSLTPDEEKIGKLEVFTYVWERDGRRLRVVIDRHSKGLAALETDDFTVSTAIDDPRLPIGGRRTVTWTVENKRTQPLVVSVLAEGEDSVRCTFQTSAAVEWRRDWSAPVTAEQPQGPPPVGRPSNRVRSTLVVDGAPVQLLTGTQVCQPVGIAFQERRRWLTPGVAQRMWVNAHNSLDEGIAGTVHLGGTPGLSVDRQVLEFRLPPRGRASWPISLRADQPGRYALRAQAEAALLPVPAAPVPTPDGQAPATSPATSPAGGNGHAGHAGQQTSATSGQAPLRTKVFEQSMLCGELGQVHVEQNDERVALSTDRLVLAAPLRPGGGWAPGFTIADRESGRQLLRHSCSLGPPFVPSVFVASTWQARVVQDTGGATVILSTSPESLPGLTFERVIRLGASGVVRVAFRATNAGSVPRALQVSADTFVDLQTAPQTMVAIPLRLGLVVDDSMRFPDWQDADAIKPERYAETWMAEFSESWVGATIWTAAKEVKEVKAGWSAPSLVMDLGTILPGGRAETPPLYVYGGQGDWKTARALWRQLVAPDAPRRDPEPRPAHRAHLERWVFDTDAAATRLLLESERTRSLSGTVAVVVGDAEMARAEFQALDLEAPQTLPAILALPARAQALPAALVLEHERTTERTPAALIRAGDSRTPVTIVASGSGDAERIRIENERLRLTIAPNKLARLVELAIQDDAGQWQNQLLTPEPGQTTFVWFNPWLGGVHPMLWAGGAGGYPSRLADETFTWTETEQTGRQGNRWRGVTLTTETTAHGQAGLRLAVSYLTMGQSNVLAIVTRVENPSAARISGGSLNVATYLQPGGSRRDLLLHYLRHGERVQKRVHGGMWSSSERWCAVEPPAGPVLAVVAATPAGRVEAGDMGHEGVHPTLHLPLDLEPGDSVEGVGYLVVADDIAQARLYRHLTAAGGLV